MTGLTALLLLTSTALCVAGFVANMEKYERSMRSPGAYWTPSIALFVPATYLVGVPPQVLAVNFGVLAITATFWAFDSAQRAKGAVR